MNGITMAIWTWYYGVAMLPTQFYM